jgi:hypothetical protein
MVLLNDALYVFSCHLNSKVVFQDTLPESCMFG